MLSFFRIHIIFLVGVSCVQMRMFRSSYFKILPEGNTFTEQDISIVRHVHDEFSCASLCGSTDVCRYALFDNHSKKCSLVKAKRKQNRQNNKEPETGTILLEKVDITLSKKIDSVSLEKNSSLTTHGRRRNYSTTATSCSDIQRNNRKIPSGVYKITIGAVTWKTRCKMTGIRGCGDGAWTLVMRISGYKNTFPYDSHQWGSKTSYKAVEQGAENKLPGYWLGSFRKLCVSMNFPTHGRINMLINYPAKSLYSLLHKGIATTWAGDPAFVTKPLTPSNIDTSCLVSGFNIRGAQPWVMKSRVGVQSQSKKCKPPYVLRGVGIGLQGHKQEMSCGEIHVNKDFSIKPYPATCRIFVQ